MVESTLTAIGRVTKKAVIGAIKAAVKAGTDISKAQLSGFVGSQKAVDRAGELRVASKKLNL